MGKTRATRGAAFEFLVDAFERIGGAHSFLVGGGEHEHREPLRQIFLHPGREFGSGFGVVGDDLLEPLFCGEATGAFEYAADGAGDLGALIQARDVSLGVLLEVELAALPGDGSKDGLARSGHAGVIVADDERDPAQAALDEAVEEGPPVHFGFTERDTHAEDDPLAFGGDAQGDEDGAVAELAVVADFFVAGIQDQIGTGTQRAVAPFLKFGVEEFGTVADLGGTDGGATEFLDDGGDFAGGDALDIHFGQGQLEGLLGADPSIAKQESQYS